MDYYNSLITFAFIEIIQIHFKEKSFVFNIGTTKAFDLEKKIKAISKNSLVFVISKVLKAKLDLILGENYSLATHPYINWVRLPRIYTKHFIKFNKLAENLEEGEICYKH